MRMLTLAAPCMCVQRPNEAMTARPLVKAEHVHAPQHSVQDAAWECAQSQGPAGEELGAVEGQACRVGRPLRAHQLGPCWHPGQAGAAQGCSRVALPAD